MRTYCITQGTLMNALWWPKWEGNPKKRGDMYMYSWFTLLNWTAETNTTESNYTLIKINFFKKGKEKNKKDPGKFKWWKNTF